MLIETSSTPPAHPEARPAAADDARDPRAVAAEVAEAAVRAERSMRIDRALDAIDAIARRRRTQQLVEAIERLGAGLDTTMTALDDAVDAMTVAHRSAMEESRAPRLALAPAPAPDAIVPARETWTPISAPLVPITAFDDAPAVDPAPAPVAPAAQRPAAPLRALPSDAQPAPRPLAEAPTAAPVATAPAEADRPRRQAPEGLAAFVIDFDDLT